MDKRPAKLRPSRDGGACIILHLLWFRTSVCFYTFTTRRDAEVLKNLKGIGGDSETLKIKTTKAQNWPSPRIWRFFDFFFTMYLVLNEDNNFVHGIVRFNNKNLQLVQLLSYKIKMWSILLIWYLLIREPISTGIWQKLYAYYVSVNNRFPLIVILIWLFRDCNTMVNIWVKFYEKHTLQCCRTENHDEHDT